MNKEESNTQITIKLSKYEALVFFDWLSRFNEMENRNTFEDQAEERILFDLESTLEEQIPAILSSNYDNLLAKARELTRDQP